MESHREKNMSAESDMLLLFSIEAGIFPVMKEFGLASKHGLVCWTENCETQDQLLWRLEQMGAKKHISFKTIPSHMSNYELHLHPLRLNDRADNILDFLEREEALTGVVTYGLLPEYLTCDEDQKILIWGENVCTCSIDHAKEELKKFLDFVQDNPDWLVQEVKNYLTSNDYRQFRSERPSWQSFRFVVFAYANFYRQSHTEEDTKRRKNALLSAIVRFQRLQNENTEVDNLLLLIKMYVITYVERHSQIPICPISNVSGDVQTALEQRRAVLYDADFYYFSESLFKVACADLLQTVSILRIKQHLVEENILVTNTLVKENFTVKIQIVNVFGQTYRARFLKIRRTYFDEMGKLTLIERSKANAMDREDGEKELFYQSRIAQSVNFDDGNFRKR